MLADLERIIVDGDSFFINYDSDERSFSNLDEMVHYYKLVNNEVIIFSLEASNLLNGRIYVVDGTEVDYYNQTMKIPKYPSSISFWDYAIEQGIYYSF